ncbi:hypothetical protein PUN28_018976 [Cardiocondyla obscurior]|uniref:C2H2-type domain-containing protein n=1 Tax=Cardiocondyla obscurior TaxID=286306 RepID=A0AAW2EGY7_9HYME
MRSTRGRRLFRIKLLTTTLCTSSRYTALRNVRLLKPNIAGVSAYTYAHGTCIHSRFRLPRRVTSCRRRSCTSLCARAYVWLHVSRVHRSTERKTRGDGRDAATLGGRPEGGKRGRPRESRVRKIYYDLLADPGRSVCHPCPLPLKSGVTRKGTFDSVNDAN